MSDEKEKDRSEGKEQTAGEAADLIKELGLLGTGSNFKSEIQYINIIGSIEGIRSCRRITRPQNMNI